LIGDQSNPVSYKYPDYAVLVTDDKDYMEMATELLFLGHFIDSDERWEFFKSANFGMPSKDDLKYLKGIIIPSSNCQIKNKVAKDEDIIKQFLKRGIGNANESEAGIESSVGGSSDINDLNQLSKQAMNIIGDDMIPQNEAWIEKLADFIKNVYNNHKHIKIFGC
jgi:hypothetical protein